QVRRCETDRARGRRPQLHALERLPRRHHPLRGTAIMTTGFDARRFKAMERAGFNRIAGRYADSAHLRAELAQALLTAAAVAPGERVLDLASGPCLLAADAAHRTQPGGLVLATDIAESMLAEVARRCGPRDGLLFAAAD